MPAATVIDQKPTSSTISGKSGRSLIRRLMTTSTECGHNGAPSSPVDRAAERSDKPVNLRYVGAQDHLI